MLNPRMDHGDIGIELLMPTRLSFTYISILYIDINRLRIILKVMSRNDIIIHYRGGVGGLQDFPTKKISFFCVACSNLFQQSHQSKTAVKGTAPAWQC